jgi:hypothetical protein
MLLTPVSTPFGEESCASPDEGASPRADAPVMPSPASARIVDLSVVIAHKP